MAKEELGTKRIDPETGKKFYDFGRDPVISPYTGKSYPLSYFETIVQPRTVEEDSSSDDSLEVSLGAPEFLTLEEADDEEVLEDNLTDLDDETTPMVNVDTEEDDFLEDDNNVEVKDLVGESFSDDEDV